MTQEESRVRAVYLFLACSQAIEQFKDGLAAAFPPSLPAAKPLLEKSLRKELGMLFRYWATRQIWNRLESREEDAKDLNLAVLRLFTEGFKLPKDGSGLRYAELSTLAEETRELSHRITNALGFEHQPMLEELHVAILHWRNAVTTYTTEALDLPLTELASRVKQWAEREPAAEP